MSKTRIRIRGDTVYEINRRTGEVVHIHKGKDKFFRERYGEEFDEEENEEEYVSPYKSSPSRRLELLKLAGNKRIISKASGLDKEIGIIEDDEEPREKRKPMFRKKKTKKIKIKRKAKKKGCGCK